MYVCELEFSTPVYILLLFVNLCMFGLYRNMNLFGGSSRLAWPAPPCSKCEKTHVRKASSGETGTEQGGSEGKRAKFDSSDGKGERKREKIQHPRL